jgi:7,8-dihydro-6-hydroxymethylpterin-pyrophosphokinase
MDDNPILCVCGHSLMLHEHYTNGVIGKCQSAFCECKGFELKDDDQFTNAVAKMTEACRQITQAFYEIAKFISPQFEKFMRHGMNTT